MYSREKKSSFREEKPRKNHHQNHPKNPSFSSTLLDEIYRSIDGNGGRDREESLKVFYKERSSTISAKKQYSNSNGYKAAAAGGGGVEDEDMASLNRAFLVEKWMEKEINHKVSSRKIQNYNHPPPPTLFLHQEDDPLFFSSTSSSSESSNSGGLSSSSDTEFYAASVKTSKSCFATIKKPKPVKTSVPKQQNEFSTAEYRKPPKSSSTKTEEKNLIKSQSRALKIYSNLKKVKDPVSPGARLTTFINNLFTNSKKNGNADNQNVNVPSIAERKPTKYSRSNGAISPPPASTLSSTCSSASSFTRSCLSKNSPNSRAARKYNDGIKRTVRFYPVSVIVDEDSRPCGHKQIHDVHDDDSDKLLFRPPTLSSQNAATEANKIINPKGCEDQKKEKNSGIQPDEMEEDFDFDDEDDGASDCSSDLFEIDHLALFGKGRFREELPVYETTHLDTNRAIASGLIR